MQEGKNAAASPADLRRSPPPWRHTAPSGPAMEAPCSERFQCFWPPEEAWEDQSAEMRTEKHLLALDENT